MRMVDYMVFYAYGSVTLNSNNKQLGITLTQKN